MQLVEDRGGGGVELVGGAGVQGEGAQLGEPCGGGAVGDRRRPALVEGVGGLIGLVVVDLGTVEGSGAVDYCDGVYGAFRGDLREDLAGSLPPAFVGG